MVAGILLVGFVTFWRMQSALAWGVVPLIMAVPWMLGDPKRLLGGYWLWATVSEYAYQVTGTGVLRYGDELLLGCIFIAMVFIQAVQRREFPELRFLMAIFFGLVVLFGLSHVVNKGSHLDAAVTAVQYLRPFILGYFAYTALKVEDLPSFFYFVMLTLLIQLGMNLAWYFDINPLPHPGIFTGLDFAVGTMGAGNLVAYTAAIGIILCLGLFLLLRSVAFAVVGCLLAISMVLTNTAHVYAFFVFMLIVFALLYSKGAPARLVGFGFAAIPVVAVALLIQAISPLTLGLDTYLRRGNDLITGRKMEAYNRHLFELPTESGVPVFVAFGVGPGNLGTAMADQRGYLSAKYHGWSFSGADAYEVKTGSIIMHTRTGLLAIWSDMGPIFFLLYWGAHVYGLLHVVRLLRRGLYADPWQRAFALTFVPAMVLYLLVAFMTDLVHNALWGCVPWVLAATAWRPMTVTVVESELEQGDELLPGELRHVSLPSEVADAIPLFPVTR